MPTFGEVIFQQLLLTDFVKKYLAGIVISILVNILQVITSTWLSSLFNIHYTIDYCIQIAISIACTMNNKYFYLVIEKFTNEIDYSVQSFIKGYNVPKYKLYKRLLVTIICVAVCGHVFLYPITNERVYMLVSQYLISFYIIELWEDYNIKFWLKKTTAKNPTVNTLTTQVYEEFLIDSYMSKKFDWPSNIDAADAADKTAKKNILNKDISLVDGFMEK